MKNENNRRDKQKGGKVFSASINKNETSDSGAESLKLVKQSVDTVQPVVNGVRIVVSAPLKLIPPKENRLIQKQKSPKFKKPKYSKKFSLKKYSPQPKRTIKRKYFTSKQISPSKRTNLSTESKKTFPSTLAKNSKSSAKVVLVKAPLSVIKFGGEQLKGAVLNQKINANQVNDSGVENLKLIGQSADTIGRTKNATVNVYKAGKAVINAPKNAVKTTVRTIKAVPKTVVQTINAPVKVAKTVYNSAITVVKTAQAVGVILLKTARLIAEVTANIVAATFNPITWIAAGIILITVLLGGMVIILFGGHNNTVNTLVMAPGLSTDEKTPQDIFEECKVWFNEVKIEIKESYNIKVDALPYNTEFPYFSNLIRTEVYKDGKLLAMTSNDFPSDEHKQRLKNQFSYDEYIDIMPERITAICYVYLEMLKNIEEGTVDITYPVTIRQADIKIIMEKFIKVTLEPDFPEIQGYCPLRNCTSDYIYNYETGEVITTMTCKGEHTTIVYKIELLISEDVMNELGFSDFQKTWAEMTELGFQSYSTG